MRYFLELSFDGTNFCGWQRNINAKKPSVQETIENSVSLILNERVTIVGCGRTDAGVHALHFYAQLNTHQNLTKVFVDKINRILPKEISLQNIYMVNQDAHVRFSAISRTYVYKISMDKLPQKLNFATYYPIPSSSIDLMTEAVHLIQDCSDFYHLCRTPLRHNNTICHISKTSLQYFPEEREIHITFTANRFLKSMIRMIMGYIIAVGFKQLSLKSFSDVIKGDFQYKYHKLAYPQGLSLVNVRYPFELIPVTE